MIEKHTIIIQTKNRLNWLHYSLNLYVEYKCKSKIVIIDGSDDEIYLKNSELISSLKEKLSIEQIKESTSFPEIHKNKNLSLFNYLKNFLNTPYFSHIPDDDLFFPNFAKTAIDFLENNKEFSAITGIEVNLFWDKNYKIYKNLTKVYSEFLQDDPLDRISHYATDQNRTLPGMGVVRSSIVKDLVNLEKELKIKPFCRENIKGLFFYEQEMPFCLLYLINGKVKVDKKNLMDFRNRHLDNTRQTNLTLNNEYFDFFNPAGLLLDDTFKDFFKEHLTELLFIIKGKTAYEDETVKRVLKKIIWTFITSLTNDDLHDNKTKYSFHLKEYRSNFKKFTVSIPKIKNLFIGNRIMLINDVVLQLKYKFLKYFTNVRINMLTIKERKKFINLSNKIFKRQNDEGFISKS